MKILNFPDNRLALINTQLAAFFKANDLPSTQISGKRAENLLCWFNKLLAVDAKRAVPVKPAGAEKQNISLTWSNREYIMNSNIVTTSSMYLWSTVECISGHKLPAQQQAIASGSRRLKISIHDYWNQKEFFFNVK